MARSKTLARGEYKAMAAALREQLVQLQLELKQAPFKVLLIVAGPEGAGRGTLLQTLAEWLDPRGVETFSWHPPTQEEQERPSQWKFWRDLPAPGRIGLYAGSWYTETLREEARNKVALENVALDAERIRAFEKLLVDSGTLILKVWLRISEKAQGRRLRTLRADPTTAWRVTDEDWHHHRIYRKLEATAALIRRKTNQPGARWLTIDAEDERRRDLEVGQLLIDRVREHRRLIDALPPAAPARRPIPQSPSGLRRLRAIPLDQSLSESTYDGLRDKWLGRLSLAMRSAFQARRALVFVFEGWDAAGKGGAIRRLTSAADPRDYRVIPVGKPTPEEKHAHYLWRFWRDIPRDGRCAVFDRSWYGRVLVERVEGFCRPQDWRRAFAEINDFERQLTEHGVIVVKFWLQISHAEQLRRFREREATPHKRHKMNAEDWRNRRQRTAYECAVGDMLALTDRKNAPWTVIPADDKRYARIQVLSAAAQRIESALPR
jgi:polyphosphate:AMP phosphotransferase